MIPLIDLNKELLLMKEPIYKAVKEVIDSGSFVLGEKCVKFENQLSKYVDTKFGIGVANGTDALMLALRSLNIGPGDEVIVPTFTFFATAEVVSQVGAKPIFVDIDPNTYNIDPQKIIEVITPSTKAIIVVHLYGQAANMVEIMSIAQQYKLKVIEDACQAIGTEYNGKRVGSIGDIGCFSFFPSKNLGAFGDAGMVVTNQEDLYEKIVELRNHGSKQKYYHISIGYNSRLDEIQAAILSEKLMFLDDFIMKRKVIAEKYTTELSNLVKTPPIFNTRHHTFHQYCIETENRSSLIQFLSDKHIATAIYYPLPLHLQEVYQDLGYKEGSLPISEITSKKILALPIGPTLTEKEQDFVISAVKEFFQG